MLSQDLLSLTLKLKLADQHAPFSGREVPSWWGRAVQQLFLATLSGQNGPMPKDIHDLNQLRPYTVSSLIDYSPQIGLRHNFLYSLRFTGLRKDISAAISRAINGAWALGQKLLLDGISFEIIAHEVQRPGQHKISHAVRQSEQISLLFSSPTFFKSHELYMPFPLPGLVFRSLLDKWNAFSAKPMPKDDVLEYAQECLAIGAFELATRYAEAKGKSPRWGAVGSITFKAVTAQAKWQEKINLLAEYAYYAGVGVGTTMGMGQCLPQFGAKRELHRKRPQLKYVRSREGH